MSNMLSVSLDPDLQGAFNAFLHFKAFQASVINPVIKYTVWRYEIEALAPSPNICSTCEDCQGDFYELADPDYLLDMFPYGEWLDSDTFSVNQHPNCRCLIISARGDCGRFKLEIRLKSFRKESKNEADADRKMHQMPGANVDHENAEDQNLSLLRRTCRPIMRDEGGIRKEPL